MPIPLPYFPIVGKKLRVWRKLPLLLIGLLLLQCHGVKAQESAQSETSKGAMRVLRDRCLVCHNDRKAEGGYNLSRADKLRLPGESGKIPITLGDVTLSEILCRITSEDESIRMPSDAPALPRSEIDLLRQWIMDGPFASETSTELLVDMIDGKDSLLDITTRPLIDEYGSHVPNALFAIDSIRNRIYVAGIYEVLVWDSRERILLERWTGLGRHVGAINVHSTGDLIAISSGTPSKNGTIHVVDLSRPGIARKIMNLSDVAVAMVFSPSEPILAIGCLDGTLKLFDTRSNVNLLDVAAHADQVLAVAWNSTGSQFISGSRDRTARVYEFPSLELKAAYSGHERTVGSVGIVNLGAVTLDETGTLRLWSIGESDRQLIKRTGLPQRLQILQIRDPLISWIDGLQVESVEVRKREEDEKSKEDDGKSKKKKTYEFVSRPPIKINSGAATCWGWSHDLDAFLVSTRDGLIEQTSSDAQGDTSWRIFP